MIKLVASDLDGTLLFKGAAEPSGRNFPTDQTVKKNGNTVCGCKWTSVCKYEKNVPASSG